MAIYMKIKGIEGQSTMKKYEKWIEVDSLGFTVNRNINTTPGNSVDRQGTNPTLSPISITKEICKATPDLFIATCGKRDNGKAFDEVDIHVCHNNGEAYIKYKLSNVLLSNYQLQGDNNCKDKRPLEILGLNYDKIEMDFTPHDEKHGAGSPTRSGYSLVNADKV